MTARKRVEDSVAPCAPINTQMSHRFSKFGMLGACFSGSGGPPGQASNRATWADAVTSDKGSLSRKDASDRRPGWKKVSEPREWAIGLRRLCWFIFRMAKACALFVVDLV